MREGKGVRQLSLHSVTQPYTTWPEWREQGGGLCSLPLGGGYEEDNWWGGGGGDRGVNETTPKRAIPAIFSPSLQSGGRGFSKDCSKKHLYI